MKLRTCALVGAVLLWSLPAVAQVSTGRVIGTIVDESGAVLPGVTVTVAEPSRSFTRVVVTDAQGQYRLVELEPGLYTLTAVLPGFAAYEETELTVQVAATFERNITLPLATVAETITVTGESPVVDARAAGVQTNVSQEIVDNVPTSRMGLGGYIAYLPGVSPSSYNKTSGMNVMGSGSSELSYNVDGIHTNSITSGGSWGFQEIDSFEEVNMQLTGASAEWQRSAGGVLNIVSKSGTNQYQFTAGGFWQPKNLVATHVVLPCNCPEGDTSFKFLIWRDWTLNAGGPIVKDNAWFYTGASSRGFLFRNPGSPTIPKDQRWNRFDAGWQSKVTWKLSENHTYKSSMYYEWYEYNYPEAPTQQIPLESVAWFPGDEWNFSHELTSILSASTVLTTRLTRHHYPYSWEGFFAASQTTPGRRDLLTGVQSGNISSQSYYVSPRRWTAEAKLNQYFGGDRVNHNVRFGTQWHRSHYLRQGRVGRRHLLLRLRRAARRGRNVGPGPPSVGDPGHFRLGRG